MILIGLGNFGDKYQNTRHNAGFMVLDVLIKQLEAVKINTKSVAEVYKANAFGKKIYLAKPLTYMNNSGSAVAELKNFYKTPIQDILVFYDDVDIALGKIKIKQAGGSGGHNGIKSLDSFIGKDYHRVRIGIAPKEQEKPSKEKMIKFVLGNFKTEEQKILENISNSFVKNMKYLINKDFGKFLCDFYLSL